MNIWSWITGNRLKKLIVRGVDRMPMSDGCFMYLGVPGNFVKLKDNMAMADKCRFTLKISVLPLNLALSDATGNNWSDMFPGLIQDYKLAIGESDNFWADSILSGVVITNLNIGFAELM